MRILVATLTLLTVLAPTRALPHSTGTTLPSFGDSTDPLHGLSGTIVLIHGFAGGRLVDTRTSPPTTVWLTREITENTYTPDIKLPITASGGDEDGIVVDGILRDEVWNPFYTKFVDRLKAMEKEGKIKKFVVFAYDWRMDNVYTAEKFAALLSTLHRPLIFAHSMGSVITLHALQTHPTLSKNIRGVIYAGGPFNGNIYGLIQHQTGGMVGSNPNILNLDSIFLIRSTWNYQPFDGRGLIDNTTGKELEGLDFYDPNTWIKHGFSTVLTTPSPIGTQTQKLTYLNATLSLARAIRTSSLFPSRSTSYPPFAVICSKSHPTAHTVNVTLSGTNVTFLPDKISMTDGDGTVSWESCQMRSGFQVTKVVESTQEHMKLLDDFEAVGKAVRGVLGRG